MRYYLQIVCTAALILIARSGYSQYSISGYLDTPEKNKRVYLSLLAFDEQLSTAQSQILTSTLTDSTGYFSFEGKLLMKNHALYRVHARVIESEGPAQLAFNEEIKNFHNFIFSNQDTIVFRKNAQFWFSNHSNTNPVDQQWRTFSSFSEELQQEMVGIADAKIRKQSISQYLDELKSYARSNEIHPLVTLVLLSGMQENVLEQDVFADQAFYTQLQNSLNTQYEGTGYAEQFQELLTDVSKNKTQLDLDYYQKLVYWLGAICMLLLAVIVFLAVKLKQSKTAGIVAPSRVSLTNQEERVAELIYQEKSNKEIASALFVSLSTVKTHIRNLYAKFEVSNREDFVAKFKNQPGD